MVTAAGSDGPGATASVDVAVVRSEVVTGAQTVIFEAARMSDIGDAVETPIPDAATVVDGTGMYSMPPLCDLIVHPAFRDVDPAHLVLYPSESTTTVGSLSGDPRNAMGRDRVAAGDLPGPTVLAAGPTIVGPLDDVGETPRRVGVMARGRYRSQAELDPRVDDLVATYPSRAPA